MNARRKRALSGARILLLSSVFVSIAGLLLCYPPGRAVADSPSAQSGVTLIGKVVAVDGDRALVTIQTDDGVTYTVDTLGTNIELKPGKTGGTDDLAPDMRVQVKGSLLSTDLVTANEIDVLPDRTSPVLPPPPSPSPAPAIPTAPTPAVIPPDQPVALPENDAGKDVPLPISLRGTVVDVDNNQQTFNVHITDHERTVYVSGRTAFPNLPAPGGTLPLHPGDRVAVDGKLLTDGTVNAAVVRMVRPVHSLHELVGSVTSPSHSLYRRSLELRLDGGPLVRVRVPRGVDIENAGGPVSVHDLGSNDVVRVEGAFDGDDFSATRIDVLQPVPSPQ